MERRIDITRLQPHMRARPSAVEAVERFDCFGGRCTVIVADRNADAAAASAGVARSRLLEWHDQFSRFRPESELSRVNADPRETVPVSAVMAELVAAGLSAAEHTGGLVDPTLGADIEAAGYADHFEGEGVPLDQALALAPPRAPGSPSASAGWGQVSVVPGASPTVTRPIGLKLDPGGIAKGLFSDLLVTQLGHHAAVVIDCGGDLRLGGSARTERAVLVESPFDGATLHTFTLSDAGVATSGIGRRSWLAPDGRPAHHLLDPGTGRPAFTGIVQVTAVAPTAAEAEARAKGALLVGPDAASGWLDRHGGVVVLDDGSHRVLG